MAILTLPHLTLVNNGAGVPFAPPRTIFLAAVQWPLLKKACMWTMGEYRAQL